MASISYPRRLRSAISRTGWSRSGAARSRPAGRAMVLPIAVPRKFRSARGDHRRAARLSGCWVQGLDHAPFEVGQVTSAHVEPEPEFGAMSKPPGGHLSQLRVSNSFCAASMPACGEWAHGANANNGSLGECPARPPTTVRRASRADRLSSHQRIHVRLLAAKLAQTQVGGRSDPQTSLGTRQ